MSQYSAGDIVTIRHDWGDKSKTVTADYYGFGQTIFRNFHNFTEGDHWIVEHVSELKYANGPIRYKLVHMSGLQKVIMEGDEMHWYFEPKVD